MPGSDVYNTTTVTDQRGNKMFSVPPFLGALRCGVKVAEVLLSFIAFVVEEVVTSCLNCVPLYFFEFISCTAFLFTLLLIILLITRLRSRVGITCWPMLDFFYTAIIAVLFLFASCAFAAVNGGTTLEHTAVAFGFLATLAFAADLVLFWKTEGLPWRSNTQEAGGVPEAAHQPEAEGLTQNH
ncbi:unnamed protein product [Merluccius merluccius]